MEATRRSAVRRIIINGSLSAFLAATAVWPTLSAQVVGRNVNMVSGLEWPGGDPFLQRQNEPSIAASTRNPLHLLAGSNDYRSVDLPGLPEGDETGDAWLGLYRSLDGGKQWVSTLLPGFPQDTSPNGLSSPIKGYQAAADPVVRAGTNGLFYYAGLAFDRSADPAVPGKSAIFVARFIDNNNLEAGDPVKYAGTTRLASDAGGATGIFLDKPWMAVDVPRTGAALCRIVTPSADGPSTQEFPGGAVYVAYTRKSTDSTGERWDLFLSRSLDCGATFTAPVQISRAEDRINQGATIAIAPATGDVFVAWRRLDLTGDNDAIAVVRSSDRGRTFTPPGWARRFHRRGTGGADPWKFSQRGRPKKGPVQTAAEISPFDQGSSAAALAFRTNSYPTMAIDGDGRIYLAWSERGFATDPNRADPIDGDARIIVATSVDGRTWSDPSVVADAGQRGHQIMPALALSGGRLLLAYYDLQEDRSGVVDTKHIDDLTAFARTSPDRRHTIDIRATMGWPGATPTFEPSTRVSRYLQGFVSGLPVQRDDAGNVVPNQLQVNPPNLPMFKLGSVPFLGDYIDVAPAPAFIPNATGGWAYNVGPGAVAPVFHVAWADNRDVRAPFDGNWTLYTPPDYSGPRPDPGTSAIACVPGRAGMRNQNIYTAPISAGLRVGSPGNAKPLSLDLQRAFVVFAENTTGESKTFRFTILNQPPGGRASFEQFPLPPYTTASPAPLTTVDVTTPKYTTASRTVYVTSTDPHATVTVDVSEIAGVGGTEIVGGLEGTIRLNPDITNPEVDNPEVDNPDVDNTDILQAEIQNPEVDNPEVDNPEVDNPEVDNPEVDNPEVDNIVISNPEVDNPEVDNPEVDNPEVDNPEVDNPEVDNTSLLEGGGTITDITWTISNVGNTTTAYNLNVYLNGTTVSPALDLQLLVYRRYRTPAIAYNSCDLRTITQNVLVANIPGLELLVGTELPGDQNDPDASNATLWLAPGEEAQVTLRVFDPDASDNVIVNGASIDPQVIPEQDVSLVSRPQPVSTPLAEGGETEPLPVRADPFPFFTVTTTADAGPGSLRAAILGANAQAGLDSILFDIPGAGPHTISPLSALPALTQPTVIDGTSQPGYAGTPLVEIEGSAAGGVIGLQLQGGASTVRALAINRFTTGIDMTVAGGNAVIASRIGTDPGGAVPLPNTTGIRADFSSPFSTIGGVLPNEGNVISGNTGVGLLLLSGGHRVVGNRIGTDATGTIDLGNAIYGIDTGVGANVIGEPGAGNLISGNDSAGTIIRGSGNVVRANRIGTNAAGTAAIANGIGLGVWDAEGAIIGGTAPGEGNQISGNGFGLGLAFSTGAAQPAVVVGNLLGTAANGVDPVGNVQAAVFAAGAARAIVGGTLPGEANTIAFSVFGAWIQDTTTITMRGNSMFGFGFQAIDLGVDGVTLNDANDADVGPNQFQNYPGVSGVTATSVGGELFSAPLGSYTIDFYASAAAGDARTWIASAVVTTDGAGYALIPAQSVTLASGQFVRATATDALGNTSELSPPVMVP